MTLSSNPSVLEFFLMHFYLNNNDLKKFFDFMHFSGVARPKTDKTLKMLIFDVLSLLKHFNDNNWRVLMLIHD